MIDLYQVENVLGNFVPIKTEFWPMCLILPVPVASTKTGVEGVWTPMVNGAAQSKNS